MVSDIMFCFHLFNSTIYRRERQSLMGNFRGPDPGSNKHKARRVTLMLETARQKGDVPQYANIRQSLGKKLVKRALYIHVFL